MNLQADSLPAEPLRKPISYFKGFLKYKFIYFNWRLITLQYYIGFAIHQHESATGRFYYTTFTDGEPEALKVEIACPGLKANKCWA